MKPSFRIEEMQRVIERWKQRAEAAEAELARLTAQEPNPFMYAIMNPEGNAHFDDMCVASDIGSLEEAIDYLDDDERSKYKIIPVYAGLHPVIPEGWRLVPLELTDEMGEAIALEARCCGGIALDIYDAALKAAPTP